MFSEVSTFSLKTLSLGEIVDLNGETCYSHKMTFIAFPARRRAGASRREGHA